jgi:2-iminobutanoate/2-iminopropanoate deaminase
LPGARWERRWIGGEVEKQQVNPWTWQDQFGFSQAWRVAGAQSIVFVSGQGPMSPEGQLVGAGDFEAQTRQTLENLGAVLSDAGASFEDVVKVNLYLTDIANLRDFSRIKGEYISGPQPASTAVGVTGLAIPGMMLELEAVAAV